LVLNLTNEVFYEKCFIAIFMSAMIAPAPAPAPAYAVDFGKLSESVDQGKVMESVDKKS
jgi:hypothetical protein